MMLPSRAPLHRRAVLRAAVGAVAIAPRRDAEAQSATMLKVVVTGGHPGDPEYGCGGTIARYARLGHRVTVLYLNRGEDVQQADVSGCPATDDGMRVHEAKEACRILGATPAFASQCNGRSVVDNAHYRAFTEQLAAFNPDVVFTQWPIDDHPDHRAISNLTYEAWKRMGHKAAFYFYEVSNGEDTQMFTSSDYVDITAVEPLKRQACYAHASQSPDHFYALQGEITRFRGIEAGYRQAEAFVRHVRSPRGLLP